MVFSNVKMLSISRGTCNYNDLRLNKLIGTDQRDNVLPTLPKAWGASRFGTSETLTCSHKDFASNGYSCFFKSIVCHKNKVILHSTSSSDLLAGLFEPDERHRLPHRCQMLPRRCEAVGLCRTSLFFASRTLGAAVTGLADNATPCHKLPRLCQPIV